MEWFGRAPSLPARERARATVCARLFDHQLSILRGPLMGWSGRVPAPPTSNADEGARFKEHAMSSRASGEIAVIGIDIGKNSFHICWPRQWGAIILRQKWSHSKGQKNDFRDAEAIAEAVQRPTMRFVATKTSEQLELQALHRVRERLVSQRTGIINQIRPWASQTKPDCAVRATAIIISEGGNQTR